MITENMVVAIQIANHLDDEISTLKDKLSKPLAQDQYKDLALMWGAVGEIRALTRLRNKLITKDEA